MFASLALKGQYVKRLMTMWGAYLPGPMSIAQAVQAELWPWYGTICNYGNFATSWLKPRTIFQQIFLCLQHANVLWVSSTGSFIMLRSYL